MLRDTSVLTTRQIFAELLKNGREKPLNRLEVHSMRVITGQRGVITGSANYLLNSL